MNSMELPSYALSYPSTCGDAPPVLASMTHARGQRKSCCPDTQPSWLNMQEPNKMWHV